MKPTILRSFAVSAILLSLASLAGCGAGSEAGSGGGETGGAAGGPPAGNDAGAPAQVAEPPPPGPAHAPDGTGHVTFAFDTLLLGDRDRNGTSDLGAWRQYGYDLDALASGSNRTRGLCARPNGGLPAGVETDGEDGIDNALGGSLLPMAMALDPNLSSEVAAGLAKGGTTVLVDLDQLGGGSDYTGLPARLYVGAPLGETPAYDGTDAWPVRSDSLDVPDSLASARLYEGGSYVVGDTWVGRFQGVLPIELPFMQHLTLHLYVRDPILTMRLDAARTGATDGTLAGVIATEDLLAEAQDQALRIDSSLCPDTPTVEFVLAAIASASDILADGTQDAARTCDGVSVGLGFTAKRVALGPIVAPEPPAPVPACSAGGG